MNEILAKSMDAMQNKTQKSTIKMSAENTDTERNNKKRKELEEKVRPELYDFGHLASTNYIHMLNEDAGMVNLA